MHWHLPINLKSEIKHFSKKVNYPIKFVYQQGHTTKTIVTVAEKEHYNLVVVRKARDIQIFGADYSDTHCR